LVHRNPEGDLEYSYNPRVINDSDHHSFYVAGIPSLQLDTGMHDDYHRPSDDADKLNYAGLRRVTELVFRFVLDAAEVAEFPRFRREALTEAPPAWLSPGAKVVNARLGVSFDREEFAANRAVVSEVVPNSAAFRARIHPGDQFESVAHWHGASVADLRTIVQVARNPVSIRLLRNGSADPIDLKVELSGDPVRVGLAWQRDEAISDGIVISRVIAESPADRAGLKVGDVLLRITGGPIGTDDAFQRRLLNDPSPLRFQVERSGRTAEVIVPLFEGPAKP
jgi:S1-C subfamily serine protease